jgi:hypothetical protein
MMALVVAVIYWAAVVSGRWSGAYFHTPPLIQAAMLLPLSLTWWMVWLAGYGWLTARNRYALFIYSALMGLFIIVMDLIDRSDASHGLFIIGEDGTVWIDAVAVAILFLAPVLAFEWVRNRLAREFLP